MTLREARLTEVLSLSPEVILVLSLSPEVILWSSIFIVACSRRRLKDR